MAVATKTLLRNWIKKTAKNIERESLTKGLLKVAMAVALLLSSPVFL
jgi:hypothetical protein